MNNRDIEKKLCRAVEQNVPDVRDSILSRCEEREGKVIEMKEMRKNKSSSWKRLVAAAAMVALVFGGAGMYVQGNAVDSIIELDVNPSVELSVNKKERVVSAEALNEDAKVVLEDMDLKGADLDVAVNALIGSMLKHGYISELQNSILITVENDDAVKGKALEDRLVKEVNDMLKSSAIEGAILSQQIKEDAEVKKLAEELKVSAGKAVLIEKIAEKDTVLKKEDLRELDINELNLLMESKKIEAKDTQVVGKASDKAYIGVEKAKAAAFANAGVKEAAVRDLEVELDVERGIMVYEVEFKANGSEYEYDINASNGEVVHLDKDIDDDRYEEQNKKPVSVEKPNIPDKPSSTGSSGERISAEKAKSLALEHAGLKSSEVVFEKTELDEDDGIWEYDIEFRKGNIEYEYEIDAKSGKILKAEKDFDD
ncbi:MAG: PepSY domain-containing protein [Firmicutes bacterium]|nr:PepSY domain-containing protein [Bacillota bacterium]